MGLSSAIDWWDEWKLRILVLCSLFVQFFLVFSEIVRSLCIARRLRVMVWIAYIGGDDLAVYALAGHPLQSPEAAAADNGGRGWRQRCRFRGGTAGGGGGNDAALEVVWAPVLLIHLGGGYISAYSLEDNQLWRRHAITLVSQVTVALYVFCKWWSGEKRLLQSAVLLFVVGILRFSERPWGASFQTLASTNSSTPSPPIREELYSCSSVWSALVYITCTWSLSDISEQITRMEEGFGEEVPSLQEYVRKAQEKVQGAKTADDRAKQEQEVNNGSRAMKYILKLFVDRSAQYSLRLHYLQYFLKFDDKYQHNMLRKWITSQFTMMYTKQRSSADTYLGICLFHVLLPGLALASVVLFAMSNKDGYNKSDITVTYILFSGTVMVEFAVLWQVPLFRNNRRFLSMVPRAAKKSAGGSTTGWR